MLRHSNIRSEVSRCGIVAISRAFVIISLAVVLSIILLNRALTTRAATTSTDTWVWLNPLPQGNTLLSISCTSTTFCKAVGDDGTVVSWNGMQWSADNSGTTNYFTGVSCASTSFCKAVALGGMATPSIRGTARVGAPMHPAGRNPSMASVVSRLHSAKLLARSIAPYRGMARHGALKIPAPSISCML